MYSYNGVTLPALPERDKVTYPHAVLMYQNTDADDSTYIFLLVSTVEWQVGGTANLFITNDGTGQVYRALVDGGTEFEYVRDAESFTSAAKAKIFWTNTDILNTDGSVYLPASDPIPVYA